MFNISTTNKALFLEMLQDKNEKLLRGFDDDY